jgi:Family of unknown function (DUF6503)
MESTQKMSKSIHSVGRTRRAVNGNFRILLPLLLAALIFQSCQSKVQNDATAPDSNADRAIGIVDQAIEAHGGDILNNALMSFDFRGRHFSVTRNDGLFSYERTYTDTDGRTIRETLTNEGFDREIDGRPSIMDSTTSHNMLTSVNSVVYFALLPLPLNDPAVVKRYLGEATISGEPYDKVEVTFKQDGGGRDYEDRFIYWFHRDRHTMDYMAYYFYVNDEGSRFRKAINIRDVGGVRIQDYVNMKSDSLDYNSVEHYDRMFEEGKLVPVSEVILDNVRIEPIR